LILLEVQQPLELAQREPLAQAVAQLEPPEFKAAQARQVLEALGQLVWLELRVLRD
jgi:hypothetical protein